MGLKPKEIFAIACEKLANELTKDGFVSIKKARVLRKISTDKRFVLELCLDTSMRNYKYHVALVPRVALSSAELERWQMERYGSGSGVIECAYLSYFTPLAVKMQDFNVILANQDHEIARIAGLVRKYILPFFEKFERADELVKQLMDGKSLNEFDDRFKFALDLLFWLGGKDAAQMGFANWLKNAKLTGYAKQLYGELEMRNLTTEAILNLSVKKTCDQTIRKGFIAGLVI